LHTATRATHTDRYRRSLTDCRRQMLQEALHNSGGNLTAAAKSLGVHRNYLYRLMKSLDLRQPLEVKSASLH
jgi:DNA-binding NtrC family response regulator